MLKFVFTMGAEVTRVHRVNKFEHDYIIRDYLDLNTEMRANAKTETEEGTFKLMNNALFGKSHENRLKHLEVKVMTDENAILKSVSKPTFKDLFR